MKDFPYLKLFTQARNDPKLRALFKLDPRFFYVWFNLFCYSGEQPKRGQIDRPAYLLAVEVSDGDVALLGNACNALQALQLVTVTSSPLHETLCNADNVSLTIRNFEKWQRNKKPSEAKENVRDRVRKHRASKKSGHDDTAPESAAISQPNATTYVDPRNTPGNAFCNDNEEEDKEKEWPDSGTHAHAREATTALPDEVVVTEQDCVELAMELFDDATATAVGRGRLARRLEDAEGRPRWDAFAAGLRAVDRIRREPGSEPVKSVIGMALTMAENYIVLGEMPFEPVAAPAIPDPAPAARSGKAKRLTADEIRAAGEAFKAEFLNGKGNAHA